jgi:pretoxin HINT domain-containing protein
MLGHLGEGSGCFSAHPSWATLPGVVSDIAVAGAAVGGVAAAGLGAAEEGAAATASEVAPGEAVTEGSECAGGACFVAGTPVRMADGSTRAIEQVRRGDLVQARDPSTGRVVTGRATRTFVREVDHTVVLTLPTGERIETTETHPFFVEGRGWVQAGQLGIGTQIVTRAGPGLAIAGIERRWQAARVYNFEVEGLHCYFVGSGGGGLCVHNWPCDPEVPAKIARGHSWREHVFTGDRPLSQIGIKTQEQLEGYVRSIIEKGLMCNHSAWT